MTGPLFTILPGFPFAKRAFREDAVKCFETESLQHLKERSYES
jgi:hypothetical protein